MIYKKILLLVFILFLSGSVFSHLNLSIDTPWDVTKNNFFISKNTNKTINFNLDSNILANNSNKLRAVYDFKIYHQTPNQIDLSLSKKEEYFISYVNSTFSLNIQTLDFNDQRVKLMVNVTLYDSFNNVIGYDHVFLEVVSNNSEYMFIDSPINKVPEYKGYSLSRDKLFILNIFDKDNITIRNHVDFNYSYDIKCTPNKEDIILDLRYQGNNLFNLEVSVNKDLNIYNNLYFINCYASNKGDIHKIKPITVNFLNQEVIIEEDLEEEILKDNFLTRILKFFNLITD